MNYTLRERTAKVYTVGRALATAETILKGKRINEICVNAIKGRALTETITLVELNALVETLVSDTLYHRVQG